MNRYSSRQVGLALLAGIVATLTLPAQSSRVFTSPKGLVSTEGTADHPFLMGAGRSSRWQQIDSSHVGTGYSMIKSIGFRRDGVAASNSAFGARTLKSVTIVMGHAALPKVQRTFSLNYKGMATTVFKARDVRVPSWTAKPATAPAAFTRLRFDSTWTYNGKDDLLWQMGVSQVTPAPAAFINYPIDFQSVSGAFHSSSIGRGVGSGCGGFVMAAIMENHGSKFRLEHSANGAPNSARVFTYASTADANLTVTGLCARLRAYPWLTTLTMGQSTAKGSVAAAFAEAPHVSWMVGQSFFLQAAAVDGTQTGVRLSLSNARRVTFPAGPKIPSVGYLYSHVVRGASFVSGPWPGGIVAGFEHN